MTVGHKHSGWRGQVLVWAFNDEERQWYRLGQALDGQHRNWTGHVSLSGDGGILVIGAPMNEDFGILSGQVRVWKYKDSRTMGKAWPDALWARRGKEFGTSIALSVDGMTVAVGADGTKAKVARLYQFHPLSGFWVHFGGEIFVEGQDKAASAQQWLCRATGKLVHAVLFFAMEQIVTVAVSSESRYQPDVSFD